MSRYRVKFYKGWYKTRQRKANADKAICYVEHHFNSIAENNQVNYGMAIVATNASAKTKAWAKKYCEELALLLNVDLYNRRGLNIGGFKMRGNENLSHTEMPAILVEPFFLSSVEAQGWLAEVFDATIYRLAQALVGSIVKEFPDGGLVAFSVGHKYKPRPRSTDRGARSFYAVKVFDGFFHRIRVALGFSQKRNKCYEFVEAEIAEKVLLEAKSMLESLFKNEP